MTIVSEFPSWPQSGLVITGTLKVPVTLILVQVEYVPKLSRDDTVPHLGQATRAPGMVSAILHLSPARVPGIVRGHLTAKLIAPRQRLDRNS